MAQFRWSLAAQRDLRNIEEFLAGDLASHAVSLVDRLVSSSESLEVFPRLGRVVPEFERGDIREIVVRAYRIVYLLQGDTVLIARVVHGSRDLRRAVRGESWLTD